MWNSTLPLAFVSKMLCRASRSSDNLCGTFQFTASQRKIGTWRASILFGNFTPLVMSVQFFKPFACWVFFSGFFFVVCWLLSRLTFKKKKKKSKNTIRVSNNMNPDHGGHSFKGYQEMSDLGWQNLLRHISVLTMQGEYSIHLIIFCFRP